MVSQFVHSDLVAAGDAEIEADRLVSLGARRVDIGQTGSEPFIVLADPEGNEFCILNDRPKPPPDDGGRP